MPFCVRKMFRVGYIIYLLFTIFGAIHSCYGEMSGSTWIKISSLSNRTFPNSNDVYTGSRTHQECITECMKKTPIRVSVTYTSSSRTCKCYSTEYKNLTNFTLISGTSFYALKKRTSCKELYEFGIYSSGVYEIEPVQGTTFNVYCNMTDGGWTFIQRRVDGIVNFDRTYQEYVNGFGSLTGNFWLGLEKIQLLTSPTKKLQIDMQKEDGSLLYIRQNSFYLGNAESYYTLHVGSPACMIGCCNLGVFSSINRMQFYTSDRPDPAGCTTSSHPYGWWFSFCNSVKLNAPYSTSFAVYCGGTMNSLVSSIMKIQ